jgi:hypothetical protein
MINLKIFINMIIYIKFNNLIKPYETPIISLRVTFLFIK